MEMIKAEMIGALERSAPPKQCGGSHRPSGRTERTPASTVLRVRSEDSREARVRPRCTCGACPACQDEARWERIFQAKFADPDYYIRRLPSPGCCLALLSSVNGRPRGRVRVPAGGALR